MRGENTQSKPGRCQERNDEAERTRQPLFDRHIGEQRVGMDQDRHVKKQSICGMDKWKLPQANTGEWVISD